MRLYLAVVLVIVVVACLLWGCADEGATGLGPSSPEVKVIEVYVEVKEASDVIRRVYWWSGGEFLTFTMKGYRDTLLVAEGEKVRGEWETKLGKADTVFTPVEGREVLIW